MPALERLPRAWPSVELPGYRPHLDHVATYSTFEYERLPRITRELDDDLAWLRAEPPVRESLADKIDPLPERDADLGQLDDLLAGDVLRLPASFRMFIADPEPRRRIRSCTACYLDLGRFPVAADRGRLIHFLSDQQWVLHWLLYVGVDDSQAVVVAETPFGFADEGMKYDRFDPAAPDGSAVCAESFSEFLYRFWIENEIWYRVKRPDRTEPPLTGEQRRYAEHYLI